MIQKFWAKFFKIFGELKKQIVVITGATSGFGFELSCEIASRGATVILASRSRNNLKICKNKILSENPDFDIHTVHLNLASLDSVQKCVEKIFTDFGKVDVLVNNAGIYKPNGKRDPYMTNDGIEENRVEIDPNFRIKIG